MSRGISQPPEWHIPPQLPLYAAGMEQKTCNRDCEIRLKRHGEATRHLADLLGHDAIGHRTLSSLLPAGLLDIKAVAAVDPDVIKALPFVGDVAEHRVYTAVITELGSWQRHWTIGRIAEVFGKYDWRFRSNVESACPAEVSARIELWLPLAEKVWSGGVVLGSREWDEASWALTEMFPAVAA